MPQERGVDSGQPPSNKLTRRSFMNKLGGLVGVALAALVSEASAQVPQPPVGTLKRHLVYLDRPIQSGDNVWQITHDKVTSIESSRPDFTLADEQRIQAVNIIKNLTVAHNGRGLDQLGVGEVIQYPVDGAIELVVQNLNLDMLTQEPTSLMGPQFRSELEAIANPPAAFAEDGQFLQTVGNVNSRLEWMLTNWHPESSNLPGS